jgi:ribokinase
MVSDSGENMIAVLAGANSELTAAHVRESLSRLSPASVIAQCEVSAESVNAAASWCVQSGARFIFNPSPITDMSQMPIKVADPLIVNQGEAAAIIGNMASPEAAAKALAKIAQSTVVTVGADGAWVARGDEVGQVPVKAPVCVADTTGAGDELAGVVAATLSAGMDLFEAVAAGVESASVLTSISRSSREK